MLQRVVQSSPQGSGEDKNDSALRFSVVVNCEHGVRN